MVDKDVVDGQSRSTRRRKSHGQGSVDRTIQTFVGVDGEDASGRDVTKRQSG